MPRPNSEGAGFLSFVDWSYFDHLAGQRRIQAALWFVLIIVPGFARLSYGNALAQYVAVGVYAFISLGLILWAWRRRMDLSLVRSFTALPVYIALMLALVFRSPIQSHAWETVIDLGLLLAFAVLVTTLLAHGGRVRAMGDALITSAILFSMANVIFLLNWLIPWLSAVTSMRASPPFGFRLPGAFLGHPNLEAGFLSLTIPLAIVRLWNADTWRRRIKWSLILGLFFVVLFFTSSRAGWISAAVGISITATLVALAGSETFEISRMAKTVIRKMRRHKKVLAVVGLLAAGTIALLWIQVQNTAHAPLAEARAHVWTAGWQIFRLSPWIGNGPGSPHVLVVQVDRLISESYFIHPHNLLLYVAGEGGLLGLLILSAGILLLLHSLASSWLTLGPEGRTWAAGGLGALATSAVHHQADILVEAPLYALGLVMITIGLLFAPSRKYVAPKIRIHPLIASICIVVVLVGQVALLRGIKPIEEGVENAQSGGVDHAPQEICQAAALYPGYPLHHIQCGLARAAINAGERESRVSAAAAFERGLQLDPYWPTHWINVGVLTWQEGDRTGGMSKLREAIQRAPHDPRALLTFGWMAEHEGDRNAATEAYRTALEHNPELRHAIYFDRSPFRREIVRSQEDYEYSNEVERLTLAGWDQLYRAQYEQAKETFEAVLIQSPRTRSARAALALALQEMGEEQDAWEQASIATLPGPNRPRVLLVSGMVAAEQGRSEDALGLLEQGWSMLETHSESHRYYSIVYRRSLLPWDLVQRAIDPTLTRDMADALLFLQSHYQEIGEDPEAERIRDHILRNTGKIE